LAIPSIGMMITIAAVSAGPAQRQTTVTLGSRQIALPGDLARY
jgi:hypothetical protein